MPDPHPPSEFHPASMRRAWNAVSADYLARQEAFTGDIWYSPLAPPESALHLIGPVAGLRILDFGCGGGQNAVALAVQGATVTGLDLSDDQLAAARPLAAAHNVPLDLIWGDTSALTTLPAHSFDLVLATLVLPYLPDLPAFFASCRRLLKPGARLIFSLDHPFRDCFYDPAAQELDPFPARSYFDPHPWRYPFGATHIHMPIHRRTIAGWVGLITAHLRLLEIVEPPPPADLLDELWPADGALAPLRHLPHTLICIAHAPPD